MFVEKMILSKIREKKIKKKMSRQITQVIPVRMILIYTNQLDWATSFICPSFFLLF